MFIKTTGSVFSWGAFKTHLYLMRNETQVVGRQILQSTKFGRP